MDEPARPSRLPTAALWGRAAALDIAGDLERLRDATEHWRMRFEQLGEPAFSGGESEAIKWIETLENGELRRAPAARRYTTPKGQIRKFGCLVSAREIADHINARFPELQKNQSSSALRIWLRELDQASRRSTAPATNTERATAARGLIAARELYDAARRFRYCRPLPELEDQVTRAELLALFRQEGSFVVSPPADTLPYAPVTLTNTEGCRSAKTSNEEGEVVRNGFCLMCKKPEILTDSPEARSVYSAFVNLLAVGGLDTIALPSRTESDELLKVFEAFIDAAENGGLGGRPEPTALPRFFRTREALRSRDEKKLLLRLMLGLAIVRLDAGELPEVDVLLVRAWADVVRVMEVHNSVAQGQDLALVNHNNATLSEVDRDDAARVIEVQQRWYASRRKPETLLAHLDRRDRGKALEPFTPFVSYLRYNAGEAIFVGILLRCLLQFPSLLKSKRGSKDFQKNLRDVQKTWTTDEKSYFKDVLRSLKRYESFWRDRVGKDTAWRHVGLIAKLRSSSAPAWLPTAADPDELKKAAGVAVQVVDCLHRLRLFPAMMTLLEQTPINDLFETVSGLDKRWQVIFARAHTFVALRSAFDEGL